MNILITGIDGFIGSYLARSITSTGQHHVFGVGRRPGSHSPYDYIQADLRCTGWCSNLPGAIDVIFHLAQSSHYRSFPAQAEDMFQVNIQATFELLEWSRRQGIKSFIFASSGNVYAPGCLQHREDSMTEPLSMYAASKLSAELLIRQYPTFFRVTLLRLFGVYGPGQRDMLIPSMIERVRTSQSITLADQEGLFLTPLYIEDCVDILKGLLELSSPYAPEYTLANLCGDEVLSLREIVTTIGKALNIEPVVENTSGDITWLCGDNSRIKNLLGFGPKYCFNDGIRKTLSLRR